MGLGKGDKTYNADYMVYEDCEKLMKVDCPLKISRYTVREAYALCKMTVISELEEKGIEQYIRLEFVEFLEFIARIADLFFEESELKTLELHQKIEHILDEILPIHGERRKKQKWKVEEFSESDEDY